MHFPPPDTNLKSSISRYFCSITKFLSPKTLWFLHVSWLPSGGSHLLDSWGWRGCVYFPDAKRGQTNEIASTTRICWEIMYFFGGEGWKKYQQPTCERTSKHDATPMTHELIKYVTFSNLALTCTDTPPPQQKHGKFHQKLPLFAFLHPVVSRVSGVVDRGLQSSWDRNQ